MTETVKPETKRIRIMLGAMTRAEWSALVEVPKNMKRDELTDLVARFYDDIDGTEFTDDNEFWDKGECTYEHTDDDGPPEFVVTRDPEDLTETIITRVIPAAEPEPGFAEVAWQIGDIQTLFHLTDEEAVEFYERNAKHIRDRLIELGWEVMSTLGAEDGLKAVDLNEDHDEETTDGDDQNPAG